jgi:hypothetical protein
MPFLTEAQISLASDGGSTGLTETDLLTTHSAGMAVSSYFVGGFAVARIDIKTFKKRF